MNLLRFPSWLAGLVLALPPVTAAQGAGTDPALEVMESSVAELMTIIYEQPAAGQPLSARVRPVLEKYFDFEYATRSAVGPGWRQFSAEQKSRTVELFTDLVMRSYADRFEPKERPVITWGKPAAPADKRREIPSTVTYQGEQYSVMYKLRETSGGWKVYDVVAENVSMIANYRAQFDELFKKGGADAVVESLEKNLREVSAGTKS